ncbi:dienelactone hydrolase family protein [Catellatospora tritici]|uniref:dienelactone hydrolase family protein n=1 Tax=Catellatospora tritici TaxID=2851566 RepID=UPI001C2DA1B8|nr:alpha/beta hydrolase [Catellatospora tritici]MBV1850710.1 alpha/beta hydrolase [Catellatospora tritici]MBV1850963.1 alpha/beta hydrolase [Catellatospora tritici]
MRLNITSSTSSDGVVEQRFSLGEIPGVLWTPEAATGPRPLVLIGHGGGQHKTSPRVVAGARDFVTELGFAAVAIDAPGHGDQPRTPELDRAFTDMRTRAAAGEPMFELVAGLHTMLAERSVPQRRSVLDAVAELDRVGGGPVGYLGMSLGCGLGVPLVAAEPRIRAAVLGLFGALGLAEPAARITVPVRFVMQWDDERVPRQKALALFDAFAATEKTLHANPGGHGDVPEFETRDAVRFLARHLS